MFFLVEASRARPTMRRSWESRCAARMPMITTTIISSISVKPRFVMARILLRVRAALTLAPLALQPATNPVGEDDRKDCALAVALHVVVALRRVGVRRDARGRRRRCRVRRPGPRAPPPRPLNGFTKFGGRTRLAAEAAYSAVVRDAVVLGGDLHRVHVRLGRAFLGAVLHGDEVRNRDRRQDADDHDHDHQLDQRESSAPLPHLALRWPPFANRPHATDRLAPQFLTATVMPRLRIAMRMQEAVIPQGVRASCPGPREGIHGTTRALGRLNLARCNGRPRLGHVAPCRAAGPGPRRSQRK